MDQLVSAERTTSAAQPRKNNMTISNVTERHSQKSDPQIPSFARRCLDAAESAWLASFKHPFVRGIIDGTLDPQKFRFYQMQDARYLESFASAASIVSARMVSPTDKLWFLEAARVALVAEGELHSGYGKKLGYTPEDIATLEVTPNNRAYQDHMVAVAQTGSLLEAVAALTPCPWLYIEIGRSLIKELKEIDDNHPYADWLKMYSDPGFDAFIAEMLELLQRFSDQSDEATRSRAVEAFVTGVRYEWMFWEQAWTLQEWPV